MSSRRTRSEFFSPTVVVYLSARQPRPSFEDVLLRTWPGGFAEHSNKTSDALLSISLRGPASLSRAASAHPPCQGQLQLSQWFVTELVKPVGYEWTDPAFGF